MELSESIERLPGVGMAYAKKLAKLNIRRIEDLLFYPPFRYNDFSLVASIAAAQPGETVTIQGQMAKITNQRTWGGKWVQKGVVEDKAGSLAVTWFNQPYLVKLLRGRRVSLAGKIDVFGKTKTLTSPEYEVINGIGQRAKGRERLTIHTGRLVPVYPETRGVSSKWLRTRINGILVGIGEKEDYLPTRWRKEEDLPELDWALGEIHFPENLTAAGEARRRLAFDELLLLQLASLVRKTEWQETVPTHALKIDGERVFAFLNQLPFELTGAQKRVIQEVLLDMGKKVPMNRLLAGDVGSGKTVIAALAIFVAHVNGFQSALMAPTQILASQHFNTLKEILGPLGVDVELLLSGKGVVSDADVLVGTHALIHERAGFANLALVIIDEQHKFGVEQRAHLVNKGRSPHVLTMTATPIPRTIALTVFGDLDLSLLDEMPPGRKQAKTRVVAPDKRKVAYRWIEDKIRKERTQAFIVCPLIEESEVETLQSVKAVVSEFKRLSEEVFPTLRLGLLHGRLKVKEKQQVIDDLVAGKLDILVATPVVEVGMDIPKASIMVVEAAERFGLAQLHQLRGRVGRRGQQGYCLLFADKISGRSRARLTAMEKINVGSELAELDLDMRGPGEIYGVKQHGFENLKIASFSDRTLIERTRKLAQKLLPGLSGLAALAKKVKEQIEAVRIEPN